MNSGLQRRGGSLGSIEWDVAVAWALGLALAVLFWWLVMEAVFYVAEVTGDLVSGLLGFLEREW